MKKPDIKRVCKRLIDKKYKRILFAILAIFVLNSLISVTTGVNVVEKSVKRVLESVGIYTEQVKEVVIKSDGYDEAEPGAWKITKKAEWTGLDTAKVTIDLESIVKSTEEKSRDVVFILDVFGSKRYSNSDETLIAVKNAVENLTNYLITHGDNKVAFINSPQYDSETGKYDYDTVLTNFTNNQVTIKEALNNIRRHWERSYYLGLTNLEQLLSTYEKNENRELVILFLTDGYPTADNPNQITKYELLKEKYSYMKVNAIQLEAGDNVIKELEQISDEQFTSEKSEIENTLFQATVNPNKYEIMNINDILSNNFEIESIDKIEKTNGQIEISDNKKITWNLEKDYITGKKAQLVAEVKLKEAYTKTQGFYPLFSSIDVKSLIDGKDFNKLSDKTAVLKNYYSITYDTNPPSGCNIKNMTSEVGFIYQNVNKKNEIPSSCPGYLFKGWELEASDVRETSSENFIMPEHDVTIRATWTKVGISKSMDGTIKEKTTLWKKIESEAKTESNGAKVYFGTETEDYLEPIYYYRDRYEFVDEPVSNNVIFANYCWQIVRTTETGGIKLLYNGIPNNGVCENTENNNIGKSKFNNSSNSLADVGYMYNPDTTEFTFGSRIIYYPFHYLPTYVKDRSTKIYYSYTYVYDTTTKKYSLGDKKYSSTYFSNGSYTCMSENVDSTCDVLYYIVEEWDNEGYYLEMKNGQTLDDVNKNVYVGTEYKDNGDGTYTLLNPIAVKLTEFSTSNWASASYEPKYRGYYICPDYSKTTCDNIVVAANGYYHYINGVRVQDNFKYSNSFEYKNGTYVLTNAQDLIVGLDKWDDSKDYHYTCFNSSGICEDIYFIYSQDSYMNEDFPSQHLNGQTLSNTDLIRYIKLSDGKDIDEVLNESLTKENVNQIDSEVKKVIDKWYFNNLLSYSAFLENTTFCNQRTLASKKAFDKSENWRSNYGIYWMDDRDGIKVDLSCSEKSAQFTLKNGGFGNEKLTYPIGLLTASEVQLIYANTKNKGEFYWTITPNAVSNSYNYNNKKYDLMLPNIYFYAANNINDYTTTIIKIDDEAPVRPVISLRPGIEYTEGDGSLENPYIISQDIPSDSTYYNISVQGNNDVIVNQKSSKDKIITLKSKEYHEIESFKLNGVLHEGYSFTMPAKDVIITDVTYSDNYIAETPHNPIPSNLNDKVYIEKEFEGAIALIVTLDYQTYIGYSTKYPVKLYNDKNSNTPLEEYNSETRKSKTIVIDSNYLKMTMSSPNSDSLLSKYFGFKAVIRPVYEGYNIDIADENIVTNYKQSGVGAGINISLLYNGEGTKAISSFKLNGKLVKGDTFEMPAENVTITDVQTVESTVVETTHNLYPANQTDQVYLDKTFEGAKALKVILEYQTYSTSYPVKLYDIENSSSPLVQYGGNIKDEEIVYIDGNYLKITFSSPSYSSNYYGFKATVIPIYDGYEIISNDTNIIPSSKNSTVGAGVTVDLDYQGNKIIKSFKLNGILINGNSFIMPYENAVITDITTIEGLKVESEHNPYQSNQKNVIVGEKVFEGAKSLTVTVDTQTYYQYYDYIYLFDSSTATTAINSNQKYGGPTRTKEKITINGNYIKIVFNSNTSGSKDYYGYKVVVEPNY